MASRKPPVGGPTVEVVKAREWQTHDGFGFEATLRMDGKPLGIAVDDGHGGGVWLQPGANEAAVARLQGWLATLPPEQTEYGPIAVTLDYYLDSVVTAYLDDRRFRRLCKTQVLVDLGDRVVGLKGPAAGLAAEARRRYPGATILNERLGVWPTDKAKAKRVTRG